MAVDQGPGDAFMVADAAQPEFAGLVEGCCKGFGILNFGRSAFDGFHGCGSGGDMDVVVVKAGEQKAACGVDCFDVSREVRPHLRDLAIGDADVGYLAGYTNWLRL